MGPRQHTETLSFMARRRRGSHQASSPDKPHPPPNGTADNANPIAATNDSTQNQSLTGCSSQEHDANVEPHARSPNLDLKNSDSDVSSSTTSSRRLGPLSKFRTNSRRVIVQISHAVSQAVDNLLFPPPSPTMCSPSEPALPRIKVLLYNCTTADEHREYVAIVLETIQDLYGEEGLLAAGFQYKLVPCEQHQKDDADGNEEKKSDCLLPITTTLVDESTKPPLSAAGGTCMHQPETHDTVNVNDNPALCPCCSHCTTRLFHLPSNTLITEKNRQKFIADGAMYDELARLCQEYAHQVMQREGDLAWVTVCDDVTKSTPVRALVHVDHHLVPESPNDQVTPDHKPTLLIATGKGKVQAGIFSRSHLLTSGLEPSTAIPLVREATRRQMSIVVIDPNARGDQEGMDTFEKSWGVLLGHLEKSQPATEGNESPVDASRSLYVVAHSAAGAQLVRYLLGERVDGYLSYLRAIAFTDSTHNIQWARGNAALANLLDSSACVYFRSANEHRDDQWHLRNAGDVVDTDSFWQHRFGQIRTLWAGTKEHSLTNWFAHAHIWDHFDQHLRLDGSQHCSKSFHLVDQEKDNFERK